MNIDDLIKIYEKIVNEYKEEQKKYEIDDYSKGVLSAYEHVLVDLKDLKFNNDY